MRGAIWFTLVTCATEPMVCTTIAQGARGMKVSQLRRSRPRKETAKARKAEARARVKAKANDKAAGL